jgi:hypothetical protein
MSRFDYSDPGCDPAYCDGLAADEDDPREEPEPAGGIRAVALLVALMLVPAFLFVALVLVALSLYGACR